MLSPLTRGYGSWDGMHYDPYSDHAAEEKLPFINEQEPHRHGITVGHMSRCSTSLSFKSGMAPPATPISRSEKLQRETTHNRLSRETTSVDHSSKYDLPKTYLTKKGALMLFTAPKDDQELNESYGSPKVVKTHRVKKLLDSSLKIGSLDRLAMSILQYGDEEEYDKENASISDEKKKMFIKILRKEENQRELDTRSQPGCDLNSYLRDLKFRASYRANMSGDTNIPRSREAMELRAILQGLQDNRWPIVYNTESGTFENRSSFGDQFTRPVSQQSTRTQASQGSGSTTPRSILSASKLRASLKSYSTYMGRPASGVIPEEENVDVGFVGEGVHIPRGDDEGDELEWEERGEEAAGTEVDLARYGVIGEEDIGEGDEIDEGTEGNKISPKVGDVHDTSLSLSPARLTKSPTSLKDQGSPERRASVARTESRASLKSQSPNLSKSQSPVLRKTSISQSNKKSPSPVQKTVSPIQTPQKTVVNEISKQIPSPEIRGKNTPPSVTITKKLSSQNLPNVTNDADTPDTQKTNKMPVGPSDKDNSLQGPKDIKHEGPKDGLPLAPAFSPVPKELDAPDTQKAQAMDEGAPEKELKAVADKSEKAEDEDKEASPDLSISPVEDKDKKKQLQTNEDKEKPKGLDGSGGADPSISTKVEAPAPPKLVDQMPVIPDYLKPKPQKTPKTKEKKAKKQPAPKTKKDVTKAMSVASIQPEADTASKAESVAKVWDHQKVEIPPEKDELVIPDHMKEAFDRDTEQSRAALEQQMKQNHRKARKTNGVASIVDDTLNHTIDENYLETGLTEEELLEAKMAVEEKLLVAQAKIEEMEKTGTIEDSKNSDGKEKAVTVKEGKGKKKGGKGNSAAKDSSAKRQAKVEKDQQAQKILKKEQKRIEEKKKLEEKRKLEDEIMARQELVEEHEQRTRDKELKRGKAAKKELKLEMERLRREELEMQEAVDEVHQYLAESRKRQREERDQRRKADQERRRDLAREKFEQDKKKREEESKKVMEELDRIHDLEMRKQKKLEEEMKREEEERIALEQAEEEEKERVRAEEDQERRVREIEVQMEEEEMQRLYNQEQEISRQRILLEMEREKMAEEEENKRQELLAEQMKYEEIKRKQEEEELRVLDEQRRRLQELKDMEEAAKLKLQQDLEERRAKALARREENLENRANMDKLKHSQGITKSWVFSYFVRWPLESYMVPMGVDETKKKGFRPRPKTAK
ncbi:axoneme-associated protein mst101(2) isoform X10 [Magallana gigas]|uniref:axoneme-associated protein mst101(2) isoform X10 n=1 Tax=Magallana gigas TaxID=29159 RepID=UPI0033402DE6